MIEFVPNWFSASQDDNLSSVESEATPTAPVKTSTEVGTSSRTPQATAAETANCSHTNLPTWPPAEGSGGPVNWAWSNKAEATIAGAERASTSDWSSRTEVREDYDGVIPTGCQPVEVADSGNAGLANGPRLLAVEEGLEGGARSNVPFGLCSKMLGTKFGKDMDGMLVHQADARKVEG